MPMFALRRFSSPETLKTIQPKNLVALLEPHAAYFRDQGVSIPLGRDEPLNYDRIVGVLMSPREDTPKALVDALYYVDEMATPDGMDVLLERIVGLSPGERRSFEIDTQTPADVAVQVYLHAPELLERVHAEQQLTARRSFEYFQMAKRPGGEFKSPSSAALRSLGAALGDEFEKMRRGQKATVFHFPKEDGHWFLVRRGEPLKREGAIEGAKSSSVFYRPERFDVLKYDPALGELSINTDGKKICTLLRAKFGYHLFGDLEAFPGTGKYTLEPLRQQGEDALVCSDVDGIELIRLTEIAFLWGGAQGEVEIRRSKDVFSSYRDAKRDFPRRARILSAKFSVRFSDAKRPRTVAIRPSNIASYTRDGDTGPIDQWLALRGFIQRDTDDEETDAGPPLAVA